MRDTQDPTRPHSAITHPACGKWWTGTTRSHCPACHRTFSCDSAADRHRKGAFGIDRHCVDPAGTGLVAVTKRWGEMWQNPSDDRANWFTQTEKTEQPA